MSRIITAYATIKLDLEVPDDIMDEQAIDEFFDTTAYSFEETENVGIINTEFVDLSDDSPYGDDEMDDEFYYSYERQKEVDEERTMEFLKNLSVEKALELDEKESFTSEEFQILPLEVVHAIMAKRYS